MNIKIDDLANTIKSIMSEFEEATEETIASAMKTASTNAVTQLREVKPSGSGKYSDWKDYNRGWKATTTSRGKKYPSITVHNARKYQLTHLLEYGHAKVGGGRVKAFTHIEPIATESEELFLSEISKGLSK